MDGGLHPFSLNHRFSLFLSLVGGQIASSRRAGIEFTFFITVSLKRNETIYVQQHSTEPYALEHVYFKTLYFKPSKQLTFCQTHH